MVYRSCVFLWTASYITCLFRTLNPHYDFSAIMCHGSVELRWSASEAALVADTSSLPLSNCCYFSVRRSKDFVKGLLVPTLCLFSCLKVPGHMAPIHRGKNRVPWGPASTPLDMCNIRGRGLPPLFLWSPSLL